MVEAPSASETQPEKPVKRRRRRLLSVICALTVGYVVFRFLTALVVPVTIGPETTVLEGPLTADGFVDYAAALNQRQSDGVTLENNAAVLLLHAYGPGVLPSEPREDCFAMLGIDRPPEQGRYLTEEFPFVSDVLGFPELQWREQLDLLKEQSEVASGRPWSRDELPELAAWLEHNDAALNLVVQATQRPRYFAPLPASSGELGLLHCELPIEHRSRLAARLLAVRATQRLHSGDIDAAWADLLAGHCLGRMTAQTPDTMAYLLGIAIEAIMAETDAVLLHHPALTSAQGEACLRDIDGLPPLPSVIDLLKGPERFQWLDYFEQTIREHTTPTGFMFGSTRLRLQKGCYRFDLAARLINQQFDRWVAAAGTEVYAERVAAFDRLQEELDQEFDEQRPTLRLMGRMLLRGYVAIQTAATKCAASMLTDATPSLFGAEARATTRLNLLRLEFALAAYRSDRGAYPAGLDVLAPEYIAAVPNDVYSVRPNDLPNARGRELPPLQRWPQPHRRRRDQSRR